MKKLLKSVFALALTTVFLVGLNFVITSQADAGTVSTCPPCYVPNGASGWTQYGSCYEGPAHCPVSYRTYRNSYSGQICRGQFGVANI